MGQHFPLRAIRRGLKKVVQKLGFKTATYTKILYRCFLTKFYIAFSILRRNPMPLHYLWFLCTMKLWGRAKPGLALSGAFESWPGCEGLIPFPYFQSLSICVDQFVRECIYGLLNQGNTNKKHRVLNIIGVGFLPRPNLVVGYASDPLRGGPGQRIRPSVWNRDWVLKLCDISLGLVVGLLGMPFAYLSQNDLQTQVKEKQTPGRSKPATLFEGRCWPQGRHYIQKPTSRQVRCWRRRQFSTNMQIFLGAPQFLPIHALDRKCLGMCSFKPIEPPNIGDGSEWAQFVQTLHLPIQASHTKQSKI